MLVSREEIYDTCITDLVAYSVLTSGRAMKWSAKAVITLDWFLQINNENSLFYMVNIFCLSKYNTEK